MRTQHDLAHGIDGFSTKLINDRSPTRNKAPSITIDDSSPPAHVLRDMILIQEDRHFDGDEATHAFSYAK